MAQRTPVPNTTQVLSSISYYNGHIESCLPGSRKLGSPTKLQNCSREANFKVRCNLRRVGHLALAVENNRIREFWFVNTDPVYRS